MIGGMKKKIEIVADVKSITPKPGSEDPKFDVLLSGHAARLSDGERYYYPRIQLLGVPRDEAAAFGKVFAKDNAVRFTVEIDPENAP